MARGFEVPRTTSTSLDSGTAAGWSLGNARWRNDHTLPWASSTYRILFQIRGTAQTTTPTPTNNAPDFTDTTLTRSIAENTAANTNVGAVIPAATDADTSDTLTYTMEGTDAGSFTFEAATRQIKTKTGVTYNFETKASYSVTIKVDDNNGGTDTVAVTISLMDVAEKPAKPAAPMVQATSGSTTSLDVSWTEPGLNGGPGITGYEVQYREGTTGAYTAHAHSGTGTSATIPNRTAGTSHQVQVRALNGETPSDWSDPGTGSTNTPANNAPDFTDTTLTRSIAENTAANTNVGAVIPAATDADTSDTLTYTMEGTDAGSFTFEAATRQIKTKTGVTYNFETKASYSVTIKVDDNNGGTDTVAVTISLMDVAEKPAKPAAPMVQATSGSTTSLDVSWTEPGLNGGPALTSYEVQYREGTTGAYTAHTHSGTGTSATIPNLTAGTSHQVQVRALNGETPSDWSEPGTGSTNNAPDFTDTTLTRSIAENAAANTNVGAPIPAATDADSDPLTYTMEGADAASFTFDGATRQIKTKTGVTYNFEVKASYSVTIKADDSNGGADTVAVTITLTDVAEQPAKPAAPVVQATSGSTTSLDVSWTAPGLNGGPALTSYEVQYREGTTGAYTAHTHSGTGTSATIPNLTAGTSHQVQVRALNGETPSDWSEPGTGSTNTPANTAPVFSAATLTRSLAENAAANTNVGAPIPAATDADSDPLTYTMEGADAASFTFDGATRQIKTKTGVTYNFEVKASYSVTIKADDSNGGADTVAVTITLTDVAEQPAKPAAPVVQATSGSTTSLDVSWTAPGLNGGPALTSYEVQYREGTTGAYTAHTHSGTGTSATIPNLTAGTSHQVQVRALNGETPSDWSEPGTGSTNTPANTAPVFSAATLTRSLAENAAANTNVGAPIPAATDADSDPLTYTMEGADAASFTFDGATRQIKTKTGVTYNFEVKASYSVTIKADDSNGGADTVAVTITLTEVNAQQTGTPPRVDTAPSFPDTSELLLAAELFSPVTGVTEGGPLVIRVRRSGGVAYAAYAYLGVTDSAVPEVTAAAEGRSDGLGRHRLTFAAGATEATVTVHPAFDGERGEGRVVTATLESVAVEIGGAVRAYELVTAALAFPVTDADAVLSVSDAQADAESAALGFRVRLDRPGDVPVRVDYATEDGTARAGENYTAVSGTLVIEAGGREATVTVPLLPASHLMGKRTLVLRLSNARNARLENGTATGTIRHSDPLLQTWLSRFGRTVGMHVVDAVGTRLRGAPGMESHVTVGGYRLPLKKNTAGAPAATTPGGASERALAARLWGPLPGGTSPGAEPDGRLAALVTGLAGVLGVGRAPAGGADAAGSWADPPAGDPRLGQSQSLHVPALRQVLVGSSFRLHVSGDLRDSATPRLTAWGQFAGTTFDGRDGALTLGGDVLTGTLGVDGEWERWLAGVAVSHSRGDGSSTTAGNGGDRELENAMTSLHPYLRYAVNERLDVWGVLGYGWGDVTLKPDPGATLETGTTLMMGAFGGRGILLAAADNGGFQLATRTDAMLTRMTSDADAVLDATDADAHRLRLVLEGTREVMWPEGQSVTPAVEIGLRHDWGDAETGFGLELGGRVRYADPGHGLTIEAAVRGLLAHEDSDYGEWGASGSLRIAPGLDGQGLALTLSPTWGAAASGVEGLWSRQTTVGLALPGVPRSATGRVHAEVSYGIIAFDPVLVTPYAGTVLAAGAARTYRVGTRLQLTGGWTPGVTLSLEGQRQEPVGPQPVNQGLQFQAAWGF